ncbi:MAG: M61 family peptidase [Alphaproteobacteria bacterium]|nr:MAG: M61 family peptidase [Alphaproteobacteria bacterium]
MLYPAGYFARRIQVAANLTLPCGWKHGCALASTVADDGIAFETVPLDVLIDSPVMAGRHFRRIDLDDTGEVGLTMVADSPDLLAATPEQIAPHRAVIAEADALFGSRPFDRYEVLLALSDDIGSIGVEHHRSCEAVTIPHYFTDWDKTFTRRDTIPHEYVHSWNGKHRRGADSWTPSFEQPIRNSLMWVYEGQTQYWDRVLCARSGLWTREQALGALALTAATYDVRAGSRWRPMSDTTRDPIISARSPLPWASWQRSEDYYSEGALVWLDVDTRIRELTAGQASLDDFAKAFFGAKGCGEAETSTYVFEDVVASLAKIAPFAWEKFFLQKLEGKHEGAPLAGLERGGYRLVYEDEPSAYLANFQSVGGTINLLFSLGLIASEDGAVEEVLWEGPAFNAGLTAGSQIVKVNGRPFAPDLLRSAVADTRGGAVAELLVRNGKHEKRAEIASCDGHRYPHLQPISDGQRSLDDILAPRRAGE